MSDYAIGIDIGGTKIAAGLVDSKGQVLVRGQLPTPGFDPAAVLQTVCTLVAQLGAVGNDTVVGVGAAGWMDLSGSTVAFSPHLSWREEPLRANLEKALGRRVLLSNDADAAGWAEYRFGAARGEENMVCVNLGTGIGGALVLEGRLQRGRFGMAGEFGHQVMVPGGHRCACGNRGCWEQYASGRALEREGRALLTVHGPVGNKLREACGSDPHALSGEMVCALASEGDAACSELVIEVGQWLGLGLANLAAVLDPGVMIIGGGLGASSSLLLETAEQTFIASLSGRGYRPFARVVGSELGVDAGLVGAAELARGHLLINSLR